MSSRDRIPIESETHREVALRLYWLRRKARLSQRELGELLGIHQSRISDIENNVSPIKIDLLGKWAEACGYSVQITFKRMKK